MQLGSMFISNCNNTLHVSGSFCVHPQEHLALYLAACHTPEAVNTVLSAPEDGRKKSPKHVEYYCSY